MEFDLMNKVAMKLIISLIFIALFTVSASAAPTVYFGEDAGDGDTTRLASHPNADVAKNLFYAQLIGVTTEDFESYADNTGTPLAITFGTTTATLGGTGYVKNLPGTGTWVGRYPISGDNYWQAQDGASNFYIEFSEPQVAFGFYATDVGDFDGQLTINYLNGATETVDIPHTVGGISGSVLYFGFIDTAQPFNRVEIVNTGSSTGTGADYFGFDDFTIGNIEQVIDPSIPEFPTIALPIAAILGLMFLFQRRKD